MSLRNTIGRGSNNIVEVRAPGLKGDAGASWRGNWASSTSYATNDLVRYIPNGNLYISTSVHTSSSSNEPTKSASQWDLFAQTGDAEGWANTARHTIFVDSTGFTLVDQTPTPSAAWEVSSSHVEVSQTSTSGSGTGVKFAITTDASGNPYLTVTNPGSTYVAAQTIVVTDPGSTSSTATVTIESLVGDSGYSAKHGALQATDWGNYTTGFVPLDTKSEDATGKPDINTSTSTITFAAVHGYSAGDTIMFQIQTNTSYPTTITAPTGLAMEPKVYYVKSDGLTTTALRVSEDSGTNGSIRVITAQGTGTLIAGNEKYSAKSWAVGGTGVTSFDGRGSSKDWATKTDGAADAGTSADHSAKAWAVGGTGITDTASHGAAKEWAQETSGNVDGTDYSAKEYAQGVQASTGGSSKDWAIYTAADVRGASSGEMSSKEWAVGVLGRGIASEGSAKDWATRTGAIVDNAEYSAKEYSVGTTVAVGSAKEWATTTGGAVASSEFSAKEYAQGTAATGGTAKEWAQDTSAAVDTTFSSKEYAQGSQGSTGGSSKDYAQYTSGGVRGATSDHSAKAWAVGGTGVTDTSSKGAAKEWATEVEDNTVAGAGTYSALHYAAKAATSASAAASSAASVPSAAETASENISGALVDNYHLARIYVLTGDITCTRAVVLGKVLFGTTDITITNDSSTRTLSNAAGVDATVSFNNTMFT